VRRLDDERVSPFDEFFENLLRARGFQIKSDAALVAIGEVPGVGILGDRLRRQVVRNSPQVAVRRLHFDDVGTEVGQNHSSAWARYKAREIPHLEAGETIVVGHVYLLSVEV